jgi:hypothetical protein
LSAALRARAQVLKRRRAAAPHGMLAIANKSEKMDWDNSQGRFRADVARLQISFSTA